MVNGRVDRSQQGQIRFLFLLLAEITPHHWKAGSFRLWPAPLENDLRDHEDPDVDCLLVVVQVPLHAVEVDRRDFVDRLIEVDNS